jgi:predicted ABC-type ATPase
VGDDAPVITVIAGVNGAGKSSIAGAAIRAAGGAYFNPDEAAQRFRANDPDLTPTGANSMAWNEGVRLLRTAIATRRHYTFETTLGGGTIIELLEAAAGAGFEVRVWYAGLRTPELHIARVAARVRAGGHDIPESDIRRRYTNSRVNLLRLLPKLEELKVYDNSEERDPKAALAPAPVLLLHYVHGDIVAPSRALLRKTPEWAKALVAAALKIRRASSGKPRR